MLYFSIGIVWLLLGLGCLTSCASDELPDIPSSQSADFRVSSTLSNQRIQAITQDSLGYIWFGTYRGLNRFNGREMHQYFCDDQSRSIPDNQVWDVFVDRGGRLWVATKNGVAYATAHNGFQHVKVPSNTLAQKLVQNRKGDIFLLQQDYVSRYDSLTQSFISVIDDIGVTDSYLSSNLFFDADDRMWIVSDSYVLCYNSYTFKQQNHPDLSGWIINQSCLLADQLWLTHEDQIRIYDIQHHQWADTPAAFLSHPLFKGSFVESMQPLPNGDLLLCTRSGLFIYHPTDGTLIHQSDKAFPFDAPNFVVHRTFIDDEENFWFCSDSQGFEVVKQDNHRFNNDNYLRTTFAGIPVAAVAYDGKDDLWIATQRQGIYSYHLSTHRFQHYDLAAGTEELHGDQERIYTIFFDHSGDLWVGCSPSGVMHYRPQGGLLQLLGRYDILNPIAISQDASGTIWIGTYGSSYYSKRKEETLFAEHRILTNTFTYTSCLSPLADGSMVALTKGQGLRFIEQEQQEMLPPDFTDEMLDACISRSVFLPSALTQDAHGNLWIGTVSNGLLHYDMTQKQLTAVVGAPCNDISSLEFDLDGNLWVSTQDGLGQLDVTTGEFINYFVEDGIGGNEFYDRSSCRLPDGTLVFGGAHGLTVFDPIDLQSVHHPRLYFENFKVNNHIVRPWEKRTLGNSFRVASQIELDYDQTNFSIAFSVLDFGGSERYNYQYRLVGYNDRWIDVGTSHEAFFSNVGPGQYDFQVRAVSKDHQRIIAERSLRLVRYPAPWASWWAWLVYIIVAVSLCVYIFRLIRRIRTERRNRLLTEREKEHERRINRMNMSFFANVSHEFRTPLTIISAPISQLVADDQLPAQQHTLLVIVQRSVNRMLRLVNQMMDFHKLEDDALRLDVRRQDIIHLLLQSAELFRLQATEKKIQLNTYGMEDNYLLWIDADKVEKIIYNLVGNAVKYTPEGGRIDISFDATAQQVRISVADTGPGIPEDQLDKIFERYYQLRRQEQGQFNWGTGIGLYYAQKLAHLHHGHILVENRKDGTGTIFTVVLPASESAYSEAEKTNTLVTQHSLYPLTMPDTANGQPDTETNQQSDLPLVLVIDDDVEIVHYVKTLLSPHYKVVGRFDAESGIEVVRQKSPDIVLCDVMMPGRSGMDFCNEVKNDLQLCHIPVVLLTAKTATSDMIQGLGSGADAYVAKPFDPSYLLALIDSILKNREKARHLLIANTQTEALEEENLLSPQDKNFMSELYKIMEQELSNPDLDVSHMTDLLHVSRSKLYYKIKGLTGENPSVFFRQYKLNRAAEMLREGKYNISEISLLTGFSSLSHFSTSFKRQFGVAPSEY